MEKRLLFLLNQAQHRLAKMADRRCEAELGAPLAQVTALFAIAKQPSCPMSTLARNLGMNNSAATGLVQRMQDRDLVFRQASDRDRRKSILTLTGKGEGILEGARPLLAELNQRMRGDFDDTEMHTVLRFLNHLMELNNEENSA